ncbi:hypothetical protein [Bosea sp. 685]|uniref:hypothetical protein n=1 Tax=Bosea sp. 685 TaxID=3080057 RepID=UPI0028935287|nr:hypothetical protein [Bosea sp. 685]WNJ89578.1 hypothetical protein RMR04_24720 [Bosea sp. 685]
MKEIDKEQALSFLKAQLADMDRQRAVLKQQLDSLTHQRDGLAAYLTGQTSEDFAEAVVEGPVSAPRKIAVSEASFSDNEKVYHGRHFNKRIVDEALAIIAQHGRPMAAPEIQAKHPARAEVSTEVLYRLMYNRAIAGHLLSVNGAFWPSDKDLPVGWDLSMARKFPKKA